MEKDPGFNHVLGWFEYVSSLAAAQLVHKLGDIFWGDINGARTPLRGLQCLASSLALFEFANPHDAIYSLMSIAKGIFPVDARNNSSTLGKIQGSLAALTGQTPYLVDYNQPHIDVCKDFLQLCIAQAQPDRALDILCQPRSPPPSKRNMFLPPWISSLENAPFALFSDPGSLMRRVGRRNGDSFVGLPGFLSPYNASGKHDLDLKTSQFRKRRRLANDKVYSIYVSSFVLDEISA
jgi:hypothetical protein